MAKEKAPNRAYLLRCWREGDAAPGGKPRWRFSLEEVLPERRRQGFVDLASLIAYLRVSFSRANVSRTEAEDDDSESTDGFARKAQL